MLIVETDKSTAEVEAPADGVLAGIRGEPYQLMPVTEVIAYVLQPGEELTDAGAPVKAMLEAATSSPIARRPAKAPSVEPATFAAIGAGGRITRVDVEPAPAALEATGKVRATLAARRIGRKRAIDLAAEAGSGPRGQVQAADVEAHIQTKAVVRGSEMKIRQMWTLSLAFDHRLVDGTPSARFLHRIKQLVEHPFLLLG